MTPAALMKHIRESDLFGPSSCTTVSEARTDAELLEELTELLETHTPQEVIDYLIDLEELHWEMSGIRYSPEPLDVRALKEALK